MADILMDGVQKESSLVNLCYFMVYIIIQLEFIVFALYKMVCYSP